MWLEPVSDGKEIVTLMCGNKTKTSVCAESLVFTCVLVWCSPVVDEASQFIMSTWEDLLEMWQCHNEDEWEEKLVVFLLFCIDIWIMDSVLNNDFRILAIVFWITAIVNQYWTVANLYNDYQLIKGAPVCGKIARFWKMSLTLADGEFRDQKILIYLLCFSTIGLFINFYFVYYSELTFSIYIYI